MNDLLVLYNYIEYIVNKAQRGLKLGPKQYNLLLPIASFEHFKKKYNLPEQFQPGMPFSQEAYEIVQSNIDSMSRFKVFMGGDDIPLAVVNGKATLPADYMHVSNIGSFSYPEGGSQGVHVNPVEILNDNLWYNRLGSSINPPSIEYPVVRFMNNYMEVLPIDIKTIDFTYLRKPNTPNFVYTVDPTTFELTYNQAASTQLDWDEIDVIDIASIILSKVAENLRSQELLAYAEKIKRDGI